MALVLCPAPARAASIRIVSIIAITVATSAQAMSQPPIGATESELRQYHAEISRNRQLIAHRLSPMQVRFLINAEFAYENTQPPEWRLSTDDLIRTVLSDERFLRNLSRPNRPADSLIDLASDLNESWPVAMQTAIRKGDQSLIDRFETDERLFRQELLNFYNGQLPDEFESLSCLTRVYSLGLRQYLHDVDPAAFANIEDSLSDLSVHTKAFLLDCLVRHAQSCLPEYLPEPDTLILNDLPPLPLEALVATILSGERELPQQLQELPLNIREGLFRGDWVYTQARFLRGPMGTIQTTYAVPSTFAVASPLEHFHQAIPSELSAIQLAELRRVFAFERQAIASHEEQSLRTQRFKEWVYDHKRFSFDSASEFLLPRQIDELSLMARLLNYVTLGPEALGELEPAGRTPTRPQIEAANEALIEELDARERQLKARIRSVLRQHYSSAEVSFLDLDADSAAFLELVARFNLDSRPAVQNE
ncbi:MAG: hypothetical protein KDA83_10645 [Planctomycetales bacterium]|nr:hypothetical protein [Planctomycetales bacterium]